MEKKVNETYTEEGKSLTEVIQEWINENSQILYCNMVNKEIKCKCR